VGAVLILLVWGFLIVVAEPSATNMRPLRVALVSRSAADGTRHASVQGVKIPFASRSTPDEVLVSRSALANPSVSDRSTVWAAFTTLSAADRSILGKRPLFASKTFSRSSKSSAFFKRAETSSEPDTTDTR